MGYFKVCYLDRGAVCWTGPMTKNAADDVARYLIGANCQGVEVKFFSA